MMASAIAAVPWAELTLFLWVLANQGGVPIPVMPALLGAGAQAGNAGGLSIVVTLTVSTAGTLCADLTWYLLGRWRGSRALDLLTRLMPKARTHVQRAAHQLRAQGSWIGIGHLLTYGGAGLARSVGIPLTFVVIATLVGWMLLRQAQRRRGDQGRIRLDAKEGQPCAHS